MEILIIIKMERKHLPGKLIRTDRVLYRNEDIEEFYPYTYNVDLNTKFSDHRYLNKTSLLYL